MGRMTSDENELDQQKRDAVRLIADSIGRHRPVRREGLPGSTCSNAVCAATGVIFLTRAAVAGHQAVVAVNDYLASLRFTREGELDEQGTAPGAMEDDFTFSLLTDLLDAHPAGRTYAERMARRHG